MRRFVWSRNPKNEEVLACVGLQHLGGGGGVTSDTEWGLVLFVSLSIKRRYFTSNRLRHLHLTTRSNCRIRCYITRDTDYTFQFNNPNSALRRTIAIFCTLGTFWRLNNREWENAKLVHIRLQVNDGSIWLLAYISARFRIQHEATNVAYRVLK